MLRLKVKTIRSFLWLGNLAVICGIALLVWQAWMANKSKSGPWVHMKKEKIEQAMKGKATIEATERSGGQDFTVLANCWELNLTGKEPPPPEPVGRGDGPPKPEKQPIGEILRVDMVYVDTPTTSCATVRYHADGLRGVAPMAQVPPRDASKKREKAKIADKPVHQGDQLRDPYDKDPFFGKVVDITPDGVLFSWGGEEVLVSTQQIPPPEDKPKKLPGLEEDPAAAAERARHAESIRPSRKLHKDGWYIGTDERDLVVDTHESILKEIGLGSEYSEEKGRRLIKLVRIPDDSLVAQRGFEVNDLIHSINGEEISSKAAAIQYFKLHQNTSTFNVEIERRGQRITKVFKIAR